MNLGRTMSDAHQETIDTGLGCLVMLLRFHGLPADPDQIRHNLGTGRGLGVSEMLRTMIAAGRPHVGGAEA